MAKSKVIKELANNEITLEVALNRLLIIASDIENEELALWAEKELNGYSKDDNIPDYRVIKSTRILYSGINGSYQVKRQPLPLRELLGKEPEFFYVNFYEGIGMIEGSMKENKDDEYGIDLTYLAGTVYKMSGIQCLSITQVIPINSFNNMMNIIKTTLLKIFIKLDKSFGNLDDLDIDISTKDSHEVEKINTVINQYIYTDNSIKIGDKNKISDSKFVGRDFENEREK